MGDNEKHEAAYHGSAKLPKGVKAAKFTPAQILMRDEMTEPVKAREGEQPVHWCKWCDGGDPMTCPNNTVRGTAGEPAKLGEVFHDLLGDLPAEVVVDGQTDGVAARALEIIYQHPDLVLSLRQWMTVQAMIEEGIRQGRDPGPAGL